MMEAARRHGAGGGEHPRGARLPPRDAQGRRRVRASDWWFKVWGPDKLAARGHRHARRLDAQGQREVARLRRPGAGLQHARPDQEHHHHAGAGRVGQVRQDRHPGGRSSPSTWPSTASSSRRPGLYSFFIMFTIGITKGRWNTLLTALQQFKDDYDKNAAAVARSCRSSAQQHPRYERMGLRDLCQAIHEHVCQGDDIARLTTEMYLSDLQPAMKPSRRSRASRTATPSACRSKSSRAASPARDADAVSAGHPAADPRRAIQPAHRRIPALRAGVQRAPIRGFPTPTCTVLVETTRPRAFADARTTSDCVPRLNQASSRCRLAMPTWLKPPST